MFGAKLFFKNYIWKPVAYILSNMYIIGLTTILLWLAAALVVNGIAVIKDNPKALFYLGAEGESNNQSTEQNWTEIIIKPLIESDLNQILFRGLFLLLVWVMIFLVVPTATRRLKRFKLFSFELEMEQEQEVYKAIQLHSSKMSILNNLLDENVFGKILEYKTDDTTIDYERSLDFILDDISSGYRKTYDIYFDFKVVKKFSDINDEELKRLCQRSSTEKEPVIHNSEKITELMNPHKLVYVYTRENYRDGNRSYHIIFESYSSQFDQFDKEMLEHACRLLDLQIEYLEMSLEAEKGAATVK